jgi:hypothetical protein
MRKRARMCCSICPYYDECKVLNKIGDECCQECPDYEDCLEFEDEEESE